MFTIDCLEGQVLRTGAAGCAVVLVLLLKLQRVCADQEFNKRFCMAFSGNILFHLNPRFDQQYVALNSKQNGSWTTEEGIQDFQFLQGIHFDLTMLITEQEVTVSFNRKHFTDFKHRLKNIQAFKFLVIEGDVVISSIRLHKA